MHKQVSVVLCGQVRRPHYFAEAVRRFTALRESGMVGEVVFSTWAAELQAYPGLRRLLAEHGVVVVETVPLPQQLVSVGNVERQVVLLREGVAALQQRDCYVFKTRPDQPINLYPHLGGMLRAVAAKVGERADRDGRLWIGRSHPLMPFFMDDRYFLGHLGTVERMTVLSSELRLTAHPRNLTAEAIWHSAHFLGRYRGIRRMMQFDWSPPVTDGNFYVVFNRVMDQPFFRRSLALYYYVLEHHYSVGIDTIALRDFAGVDPAPLEVEVPEQASLHETQRRQVFDNLRLHDAYAALDPSVPDPSAPEPEPREREAEFDALDAALTGSGRFVARARRLDPEEALRREDAERAGAQPGLRQGGLPGGALVNLSQVRLDVAAQRHVGNRTPTHLQVTIANADLQPIPDTKATPLMLGYKWFRDGQSVWEEFPRVPVGQPVSHHLQVAFTAGTPPHPGEYEIEVDLLYEGVFWFGCAARAKVLVV